MLGSSGASVARMNDELSAVIGGGADGAALGDGLLAAAAVLRDQVALRRAVTDPSTESEAKSGLARSVFGSHLDGKVLDLVAGAAGSRWGSSRDLPEALEKLGVTAIVKGADSAGEGDRLEDELFAFGRAVVENPDLRSALSDPARSVADKQGLVAALLDGKAASATVRLAREAVTGTHGTVTKALEEYSRTAAGARQRLVATVRVASALTAEQSTRLAAALGKENARPVHLNTVVDPSVVGGIHVEIGDFVVDGSISARVDDARRQVAG
ncbi:F0F1 ATP synthase subunit delta [Nocardioides marmorisolisilvae]|uniref:ATP synthase subunit delta n=1 Tax=Nocardioides marmorisolisilvae TaxID=1542737 RepID=A0A3N0DWN4_9ACTN|nr:F0F1 ATP synthase subunit delta [Nocardioides marmorisolisilvae]RNL80019.1 F0F1 ATP synthase subunit delta [Nocardioides marmorisolisilvae]